MVCGPEPLPQSLAQFVQVSPISHVRSPQTGPPLLLLDDDEELLLDDAALLLEDDAALLLEDDAALLLEDDELDDISPLLLDVVLPIPPLPLDA